MEIKRPGSRKKGESTEGKGVFKRGQGTGQGPVGTGQGPVTPNKRPANTGAGNQGNRAPGSQSNRAPERQAEGDAAANGQTRGIGLGDILDAMGSGDNPQTTGTGAGSGAGFGGIFGNGGAQNAGSGLGPNYGQQTTPPPTGQTGNQGAFNGNQGAFGGNQGTYGSTQGSGSRRRGGIGCLGMLIILLVLYFLFRAIFPSNQSTSNNTNTSNSSNTSSSTSQTSGTTSNASGSYGFGGLGSNGLGTTSTGTSVASGNGYSSGWQLTSNNGILNTDVNSAAREKYTNILGNGQDTVTMMVYMCGTDLESNYAMATRDLQEMLAASLSDNIRIVLFTGGCSRWQNDVMSSSANQIYEISTAGLRRINDNAGTTSMTDPSTLASFVAWAGTNYPANRNILIMWDHGGGSVSGYGYDQLHKSTGAMSLMEINQALGQAGVKFDFIGFDACLMATAETALMASNYADYLVASEEVEPGIGWYYTDWLNTLSSNTSISTLELGKQIIDDYTVACQRDCPGQDTTLSIVDLAELQNTLPAKLSTFGSEAAQTIDAGNYQTISQARTSSREFSQSSKIDQIDFIHFANLIGTDASKDLAKTLMDAVKYNRTSKSMTNAYGLSVYFPYRSLGSVDTMTSTYAALGIDDNFAKCMRSFARLQVGGQVSSGGSSSPLWSLLNSDGSGSWSSGSSYGSGYGSTIDGSTLESLLSELMGSGSSNYDSYGLFGLGRDNTRFMTQDDVDVSSIADFVSQNTMSADDFVWKENSEGYASIQLTDDQWAKISSVEMSVFYDDGEGYIDLGLDTIFDIDQDGNLLPVVDNSWISIDGQPVAYYHVATFEELSGEDYTIVGRVPVMLNEQRADLILVFDGTNPDGYIAGARYTYPGDDEVETVAKAQESLTAGDTIDFLCDYYSYDGEFQDSYYLGEQYVVENPDEITISNTVVGDDILVTYKFVDMFGETYWTPALQ